MGSYSDTGTEALVQLRARCPKCGKRERRRIAKWRLEFYEKQDPERICETIICECGQSYMVTAAAYQGAA